MNRQVLAALLREDLMAAEGLLGCQIPRDIALADMPLARRLEQLKVDPTEEPWLLRAMVDRTSRVMVGRIGFHTPPRPAYLKDIAPDGVELGYSVHPPFQRQGYAREAAIALMRWAHSQHDQKCFIVSISPQNIPSTAMAADLGFTECGSHIDEEDGLEIIFSRRFVIWPGDWM